MVDGTQNRASQSAYVGDADGTKSLNCNGIWMRFTVTFSASGMVAPIYITITGLTEADMPRSKVPNGQLVIPIEGLTYDGSVDPRNKEIGYVVFIWNDSDNKNDYSQETLNFPYYQQHVFYPFLDASREKEFQLKPGDSIPDWAQAVQTFDGCNVQLTAMTNSVQLEKDKACKIVSTKIPSSTSSTTQAADLSPGF